MKKYFYLQLKRIIKIFPFVTAIAIVLLLGLSIIISSVMTSFSEKSDTDVFSIGITGDADSSLVSLAISAFESSEGGNITMEFVELSEDDAKDQLATGEISAYIILPENFVENALMGDIDPVTYVTTPGATGVVSMFKNEITKVVTDIIVYSQKGTYGVSDALSDNGYKNESNNYLNEMALEYASLALERAEFYTVEELGKGSDITTAEYFMCGLSVLLIMLMGLPFATIYTKKDYSFNKLMISKGYSNKGMLACEYMSHLISILMMALSVIILTVVFSFAFPDTVSDFINKDDIIPFILSFIPVIVMVSTFNIMFFELSTNIVSSVLMHFLTTLCLCYIGGCLYPISTFPVIIQKISAFIPSGVARSLLSSSFDGKRVFLNLCATLIYAAVFFCVAVMVRNYKTTSKRR